jgi:hypothetical protein
MTFDSVMIGGSITMKKIYLSILLLAIIPFSVFGQLRTQDKPVAIQQELVRPQGNEFMGLGLLDPSRFTMSHSIAMSYFSVGDGSVSQSLYMNTMTYQIASPLMLKVQWGLQSFPHNTLAKNNPAFQGGLFISGAELKYKPSDKFEMKLQFNQSPYNMYNRYRYDSPFSPFRNSMWDDEQ